MKILFVVFIAAATLVVQQTAVNVEGEGQYTIVGPAILFSEHDYNVAITLHHTKEPVDLEISIEGPTPIQKQAINLSNPNELKKLSLKIPKLDDGDYRLKVKGVKGLLFTHTEELNTYGSNLRSFIQMDKTYYKPGDIVHYRVVFLNENLKPVQPDSRVTIAIKYQWSHRIAEIKNFKVVNGVYTGKYILTDTSFKGEYSITVLDFKQYDTGDVAYFTVRDPPISFIDLYIDISNTGDIDIFITSNITNKPVNGRAAISFLDKDTVIDIVNGTASLSLNLTKEQRNNIEGNTLVSVVVLDKTMHSFIRGETFRQINPNRYIIDCARGFYCDHLHSGKKDIVGFKITHLNGTRVTDSECVVRAIYTDKSQNQTYTFESHLNRAGVALFKILLPESQFDLDVEYEGEVKHFYRLYSDRLLTVHKLITEDQPKDWFKIMFNHNKFFDLDELAMFTINSSSPMQHINYYIIGRGNILEAKSIQLSNPENIYNLNVRITNLMMPHSHLYVYYIDDNGDYHLADTIFKVNFKFEHEIEIIAPNIVKPGSNVTFKIITTPNSIVALTAVDERIGSVINDIRLPVLKAFHPKNIPGEDYNIRFLTNANKRIHKKITSPDDDYYDINIDNEFFLNMMNSQGLRDDLLRKGEHYDVEKTWIFDNINNTNTENFKWTATVPEKGNTWLIKAFAVHPDKGLALLEETIEIDVDARIKENLGMDVPDVLSDEKP